MKRAIIFGSGALLLVLLAASAFAGFGNEAARNALGNGDYASWKSAMTAQLAEENFAKLKERHNKMVDLKDEMDAAMQQGYDSWKALLEESGRGQRLLATVTPENFGKFVAMHEAKQQGNLDEANALAEQLGLKGIQGRKNCFRG
ncbi:MAG: hypothetical protein ABIF10_07375 [Candidatus Woesearchaeota archaeon]